MKQYNRRLPFASALALLLSIQPRIMMRLSTSWEAVMPGVTLSRRRQEEQGAPAAAGRMRGLLTPKIDHNFLPSKL